MRTKIKQITEGHIGDELTVFGWVKTLREQKQFAFIEINDGSTLSNLQVIAENYPDNLSTGSSVRIKGQLIKSPGGKQKWEIKAEEVFLFGSCPADYPLQKKRHSFEFLRSIAHLRPRSNTQGAVARVRHALFFATHQFFQNQGFIFLPSPIITSSDTEGAGELFRITTLDLDKLPKTEDGKVDTSQDFFGKSAYLTVSGQLNGEAYACSLSDVYTFGPTFRAENSHTTRHLSEFWMIEPEIAFADLQCDMQLAESYLKYVVDYILKNCSEDMQFFDQFIEKGLIERLEAILKEPFAHLTYTDAIEILQKANRSFEFPTNWGADLQTEHERYLSEEHCKKPVFITDYPRKSKAFYMRDNDDGKTVAAMDLLVPKVGELIGGSQREERLDQLINKIKEFNLDPALYEWYLDLRKYGSVPHAGFGVGFERLILFATGMENIRDVNAFPRYPGHADF